MDTTMANDGHEPKSGRVEHRGTYDAFVSIAWKAIIAVAVVLILMAIFLA
jgi:membrane protein required for beta-lactamase induction